MSSQTMPEGVREDLIAHIARACRGTIAVTDGTLAFGIPADAFIAHVESDSLSRISYAVSRFAKRLAEKAARAAGPEAFARCYEDVDRFLFEFEGFGSIDDPKEGKA